MCREICDGAGPGICDGVPSNCPSLSLLAAQCLCYQILSQDDRSVIMKGSGQ